MSKYISSEYVVIDPKNNRALSGSKLGMWNGTFKVWVIPMENKDKALAILAKGEENAPSEPVKVDPKKVDVKKAKGKTAAEPVDPDLEEYKAFLAFKAMKAKAGK